MSYKHFLTWWLSDLSCKLLTVCPAIHLNYKNVIMWKICNSGISALFKKYQWGCWTTNVCLLLLLENSYSICRSNASSIIIQNYNQSLLWTTLSCVWKPLPGNIKSDDNSAETCNKRVSCQFLWDMLTTATTDVDSKSQSVWKKKGRLC